ncbi:MAG TPA: hypothetical protein PLQ76_02030 [bacterium]|nr:hypothetical protein [bacterium]
MPTADVQAKNRYAASFYTGKYSFSESYKYDSDYLSDWGSITDNSYSMNYGLGRGLEISGAERKVSGGYGYSYNEFSIATSGTIKGRMIGIKYNPGKKYFLNKTTAKKWAYAFGAQRYEYEHVDGSYFFGVVDVPTKKFNFHLSLFQDNYQGISGTRLGTMAGAEFAVTPSMVFIGEMTLYQGEYTWNWALRYVHQNRGSILLGLNDTTDYRYESLGLSFNF